LDIIVKEPVDPTEAFERIVPALPVGIGLSSVEEVPLKGPTLQQLLKEAEYRVTVETDLPAEELSTRIEALLTADKIMQTRKRRKREEQFDMRPLLHELRLDSVENGDAHIFMRVTAGQHGNLRPEAVLKALGLEENWVSIERGQLIFEVGEEASE